MIRRSNNTSEICRRSAFTLIELVVVAGIITLLLAMTLPGLARMWDQRKEAQVQNTLRGVLASARMQAKSSGERGLFFCLIDGVQKVYPIVHDPIAPAGLIDKDTLDRFKVVEGDVHTFPDPLRIVPRYVVDDTDNDWEEWDKDELKNENYRAPVGSDNHPQIHRNFFTMIFSADGQLMPIRNVIIHDPDLLPFNNPDGLGDRTGFEVDEIETYFGPDGTAVTISDSGLIDIVINEDIEGINFISVDGVLVYDESVFRELAPLDEGGELRRELIIKTGRPMYVGRMTGEIIVGPVAESEAPPS